MKIKTSELAGAALDWAAGLAEGYELSFCGVSPSIRVRVPGQGVHVLWQPTHDWNQGGPIVEREWIKLTPTVTRSAWMSQIRHTESHPLSPHPVLAGWTNANGPTPLIAAMRCYVASKLGDEVDIPDGLTL